MLGILIIESYLVWREFVLGRLSASVCLMLKQIIKILGITAFEELSEFYLIAIFLQAHGSQGTMMFLADWCDIVCSRGPTECKWVNMVKLYWLVIRDWFTVNETPSTMLLKDSLLVGIRELSF